MTHLKLLIKVTFGWIFMLMITMASAQVSSGPDIAWQQCYGGTNDDYFTDAIITKDNGILAAIRPASQDGDLEGLTVAEASGWVIKYNQTMSILWQKHYGYTDCFREVYKIIELANGEIIFGGAAGSFSGSDCAGEIGGGADIFLLKTDSLGNEIWYQTYGSPYQDLLTWLIPTSDGGFLLTGTSMGSGGDIPFHYGGTLSTDAVVLKTDSLGELEWVQVLGGSSFDLPRKGTIEIQPDLFQIHIASTSDDYDFFDPEVDDFSKWLFVQIDIEGNIHRDRVMSAEIDFYNGSNLFMPYHSGVLACGTGYAESLLFTTAPEHEGSEGAIMILDSLLDITYFKQWGGSSTDVFVTATHDELGNYYFFGVSKSADHDVLENHYEGEEENYWILATDSSFNTLWSKSFGGGNNNCGDLCGGVFTGTLIAKDDMLYVFTESVSPEVLPDFDIECGHYNELFPLSDAWLVAFDLTTVIPEPEMIQTPFTIYPNPTSDILFVQCTSDNSAISYTIRSLSASILLTGSCAGNEGISVDQLPSGLYFITLETDDHQVFVSTFCKI
ncbi:MAG: T9SS type A sorting domain-containing protein [Chitinophagales bacterium]|nr:T9SS type A sorting domain-containing protein [Chitinophagales bacterium]